MQNLYTLAEDPASELKSNPSGSIFVPGGTPLEYLRTYIMAVSFFALMF